MAEEDSFDIVPATSHGTLMSTVRTALNRRDWRYKIIDAQE